MNGVLLLDKPAGPTSHDMVYLVRRVLQTRKVGHAGTLDPFATGLLIVLIGNATKISNFLINQDKTYVATLAFGAATDTQDHTGQVTETSDASLPIRERIEEVLAGFVGEFEQIPPMYSAKKVDGQTLYKAARRGEEIERESKMVHIFSLELIELGEKELVFRTHCSKGTYIRVVADRLARALGGVGHLSALRREQSGAFSVNDALTPEVLEKIVEDAHIADRLIDIEAALTGYARVVLTPEAGAALIHGQKPSSDGIVQQDSFRRGETLRLMSHDGRLLAMARALLDGDQTRKQSGGVSPFELLRVFAN